MLNEMKQRWRLVVDHTMPRERRVFAFLEMVFMPVSFLTLGALVAIPVLGLCGVVVPGWMRGWVMTVMVSAAIGYITNWIAIEMLFKPYHQTLRHPFAWLTCGYWRQGLVPKNKHQIAGTLGEQVATKLLQPEMIAEDLCKMTGSILQDQEVLSSIKDGVRQVIENHGQTIASFLTPKIEAAMVVEIDQLLTVDKIEEFWTAHIEPKLQSPETRDEIASILIAALDKRVPTLAAKAKPLVVEAIENYVMEKGFIVGTVLAPLTGDIADFIISHEALEKGLRNWLNSSDTIPMMREELLVFVKYARDYLKSDASRQKIGAFVEEMRTTFKNYVRTYIETNLAEIAGRVLNSETVWNGVTAMIAEFQPVLERFVRTKGVPMIMKELDIPRRIETAVDKMDVAEFHGMINEVAAQHLGAIQVLGYILGAAAGALALLV